MPRPLQCPKCGATEATLLQDNIYQCKTCGAIYDYDSINPEPEAMVQPTAFETKTIQQVPGKVMRSVVFGIALVVIGFAAAIFFSVRSAKDKSKTSAPVSTQLFSNPNE